MPGSIGGGHGSAFGSGHGAGFGGGHGSSFGGGHTSFSGGANKSGANIGLPLAAGLGGAGRRGGCLPGVIVLMIFPLMLIFVTFGTLVSFITADGSDKDMTVTLERENEKLGAEYCLPLEDCCESDLPDIVDAEGEERINGAIGQFYEETGVQPYFYLTGDVFGSESPNKTMAELYMTGKYIELFGEDEGHLLVMMIFRDYDDYDRYYMQGDDITGVISAEDCDLLLSNMDYCAEETKDVAGAVANAFEASANDVMYVTVVRTEDSEKDAQNAVTAVSIVLGLIIVCGLMFAGIYTVVRKNRPAAAPAGPTQYTEVGGAPSFTGSYPAGGTQKQYNYPVRCPHCGATDYPRDDGTCEYCNGKIG